MGPCWLDIRGATPSRQALSWCKLEAVVESPKLVTKTTSPPPPPPLVVLALSMQTMLNKKTHQHEVCAEGARVV